MEAGPERELMTFLFLQVKQIKGLTTALDQKAGINGKWLKPNEPYNIPSRRLLRMIIHMAHELGREQFKQKTNHFIEHLFDDILPLYARSLASKQRQRPPWRRRLYRRRYLLSRNTKLTQISL